jgi:hypothetical protein
MEILISLIVGIVLMEMYAWLDPLALWIVRRAAKVIPDDRHAEFVAQWEGDLAAVPNSIMKVGYVLRDCLLPIKDIQQTMFRNEFEQLADESDVTVEQMTGKLDNLQKQFKGLVTEGEVVATKFVSTLNFSLERLHQFHDSKDEDACSAIERVRASNQPLTVKLSNYVSVIEHNHALVSKLIANLREPFARVAEASLRVRDRLRDDSPIVDKDLDLLESLHAPFADINLALGSLDDIRLLPNEDLLPSMSAAVKEIKAAVRLVKGAKTSRSPAS